MGNVMMADGSRRRRRSADAAGILVPAAIASAAAGLIHAAAIGVHTDQVGLTRLFIVAAVAQLAVAVTALIRPTARASAALLASVNAAVFGGWLITRLVGISWIDGLQRAEAAGLADSVAAAFAAMATVGGALVLSGRVPAAARVPVTGVALLIGVLAVPAVVSATSHGHDDGHAHAGTSAHDHGGTGHHDDEHSHAGAGHRADPLAGHDGHASDHGHTHDSPDHRHDDDGTHHTAGSGDDHGRHDHADEAHDEAVWPRPWDPALPFDFSGVPGVTAAQQARAEQLVANTLAILPRFADVTTIEALGFRSIGDARTGFEHFINIAHLGDDSFLDPARPESLVYRVDGEERTLVSAMFIASNRSVDDPELVDVGGALMEWHVHDNLCWGLDDSGAAVVKAVTDDHGGVCPPGTVQAGADSPMVHVWITPHECGPFAALEGHGAGQTADGDGQRADQCHHDHGDGHRTPAVPPRPYDPELPIDLSGVSGVTPQQQAFAENLVAVTLRYLPQWSDPAVAEAAGFRSIGDGATGHEHFVHWDWIDDDVWLDPTRPESLVYEPQPDGSRRLVSAMYMLPADMTLDEIPDWGGALMQWHIHDDLCFTDDPVAPQVGGIVAVGAPCPPPLVRMAPAPMIHVWIRPHECGPFAALDGIGAGQVRPGEAHRCNHAHGSP